MQSLELGLLLCIILRSENIILVLLQNAQMLSGMDLHIEHQPQTDIADEMAANLTSFSVSSLQGLLSLLVGRHLHS